ncbi:unnamed protein product [Rangifer tarandus platyrhynchus]|uniref:Uncharacterized protein n=1 Tax=Rangifer tarandus platyrhynchus TaxID=3082113 RepID=A0AC59Z279_RANTA
MVDQPNNFPAPLVWFVYFLFSAFTTGSSWTMNLLHSSCCNTSAELLDKSWNGEFAYQTLSMVDTVILPSMVGILCSTGLVGNILIVSL